MINELLENQNITEMILTEDNRVIYELNGKLNVVNDVWKDPSEKDELEKSIVNSLAKAPSYENPMATGVWADFRVQVLSPPVISQGMSFQLRRFACNKTFKDFNAKDWGQLEDSCELENVLKEQFEKKSNFLIVGATGCGKTTLLKSLLFTHCVKDRVVCLEDTPELPVLNEYSTNLKTYFSSSPEIPHIDLNDLVQTSLRLRPDRLIMGEMRGQEAASFLLMLSTGHKGSGATLHAKSPLDALYRLEMLTQLNNSWSVDTVRKLIYSALDMIVVVDRNEEGNRVISEISEIAGLESGGFLFHSLYKNSKVNCENDFY
jgi:pilus assembly protein CpaF